MPQARNRLVSLDDTPYYHCTSRCVRRAFLCGVDTLTGRDFSHRRGWIESRLLELTSIFAIDLCAYAVMSNHYHVVILIDRDTANAWSADEVLERWTRLFSGPPLINRYRAGDALDTAELDVIGELAETYRHRLHDLSWFMRCVNEPLARLANEEDGCTGRFWEGRFKSQALLDEAALISCMAYVDLNPIRAGMAQTPEHSDHTAIQARIRARAGSEKAEGLLSFGDDSEALLPHRFDDYLDLVDWAGRAVRSGKKGFIPNGLPPIAERLQLEPDALIRYLSRSEQPFYRVMGPINEVRAMARRLGKAFFKGSLEASGLITRRA